MELLVTRDGEVDKTYMRRQQLETLGNTALVGVSRISRGISRAIGEFVADTVASVELEYTDAKNGTHLRHEFFEAKRQAEEQALRDKYDLVF